MPLRHRSIENQFFVALLLIASAALLFLIHHYILPVFWAALLASLFHPVERRLRPRVRGSPSLSAVLTVLLILLVVILPLVFVGLAVTRESAVLIERISSGEIEVQRPVRWVQDQLPLLRDLMDRAGIDLPRVNEWLSSATVTTSGWLASQAVNIGQNALTFTIRFFVMAYLLFFFLRDGAALVERLIHVVPIGDQRERRLIAKLAEVSRATIKGTLVVGVVQGTIGGIAFAILGFQAAVFWGVVMTVLSILPAVGTALIWVPAAIWLFATGEMVQGIALVVVGTLLIGLVDNVLRPILVGRDTKLPDYLVLLSTLGGLGVIGISGFVLGPILAALCLVGWDMFADEFAERPSVVVPPEREPREPPPQT